ncbi:MAG: hypothetical protein ACI4KA_10470 [Oscillospiraceae bacterium]
MKKGLIVKGMAVTLAAVMLTGCGAMTAEEYQDGLKDALEDYQEAVMELSSMMFKDKDDFDNGEAKKAVKEAKDALNDIKKLNLPKEIKDEHKELAKCIDVMMEMTDLSYDYIIAYVKDDDKKMEKINEKGKKLAEKTEDYTDALEDLQEGLEELLEEEEDD